MSFKDLGKNVPAREDKPEDAELRARAAARHKAKEEKGAKSAEHRAEQTEPRPGGGAKREPHE